MTGGAGDRGTDFGAPRRGRMLSIAAAVLVIAGGTAVTVGLLGQQSAPQAATASSPSSSVAASPSPSASSSTTIVVPTAAGSPGSAAPSGAPSASASASAPTSAAATGTPFGGAAPESAAAAEPKAGVPASAKPGVAPAEAVAEPVRVRIPAIGVESTLIRLGLNPDGTLEVPQPGPDYDKAGWFIDSPAPGEVGPAVIEGHIDSAANGPSVFFQLGAVAPGNEIEIDRADGSTVRFVVDKVAAYPKDHFPTLEVYGNTAGPELRLITCGGDFDAAKGSYRDNTVVYAHLSS